MNQNSFLKKAFYSMENVTIFSLENFLKGHFSILDFEQVMAAQHDAGAIQFAVELSDPVPVHLSPDIGAQSFQKHHDAVKSYLGRAEDYLFEKKTSGWVTGLTLSGLLSTIGQPPPVAHPIYFISSEKDDVKKVVYVGKTAAESGRFVGGHRAISMLHDPAFDGTQKNVYMASVLARFTETEWVNLELINPRFRAEVYLSDVELNLIFRLQPVLNDKGKSELLATLAHNIHVMDPHSMVESSHGIFCYKAREPE
jgi:hypothetical protein